MRFARFACLRRLLWNVSEGWLAEAAWPPGGGRPRVSNGMGRERALAVARPGHSKQRTDQRSRYAVGTGDPACTRAGEEVRAVLHVGLDLSRKRIDVCLIYGEGEFVDQFRAPAYRDGLYGLTRRVAVDEPARAGASVSSIF
jgi:hypothetical protein